MGCLASVPRLWLQPWRGSLGFQLVIPSGSPPAQRPSCIQLLQPGLHQELVPDPLRTAGTTVSVQTSTPGAARLAGFEKLSPLAPQLTGPAPHSSLPLQGTGRALTSNSGVQELCAPKAETGTLALASPPRYMSDAVWLQRPVGPERVPTLAPNLPPCPCAHCHPPRPGTPPQPVGHCPGKGPLGGGEAGSLQEVRTGLP